MSTDLKAKIFDSCTLSVITYDSQIWAAIQKQLNDLATSQIDQGKRQVEKH